MADYTYETRRKMTEDCIAGVKARAVYLSSMETHLLSAAINDSIPPQPREWMLGLFGDREERSLSDIYKNELFGLTEVCVPHEKADEFYYALDQMNQFQMTAGWYRRSVRGKSYSPFISQSLQLLWAYAKLEFYGGDLADLLTGNVDPEIYDHARSGRFYYGGSWRRRSTGMTVRRSRR